jgi:hypothetical protein
MVRKRKWTKRDQALLEELVKRHGADLVVDRAQLIDAAPAAGRPAKGGKGQSSAYKGNCIAVWLAVEMLRRAFARASKPSLDDTFLQIAKALAERSLGITARTKDMTKERLKSLYCEALRRIRASTLELSAELENAAEGCAREFMKRRGTAVLPVILHRADRLDDLNLARDDEGIAKLTIKAYGIVASVRFFFPADAL